MSKVVKFYYTRPLSFLEVAIVPIRETVAVPQQKNSYEWAIYNCCNIRWGS